MEEVEKGERPKVLVRPNTLKLTHLEVVQYAYKYFNVFKGLSLSSGTTAKIFFSLKPMEALMILEVDLSFMYGTYYTKLNILHTPMEFSFCFLALACLSSSLWIFIMAKKHDYNIFDVGLTYCLLIEGIALDFVAIFIFCVSDWSFAKFRKQKNDVEDKDTWVDTSLNWLLSFRKLKWKPYKCFQSKDFCLEHIVLDRKFLFRRWPEYVYACNLLEYSLVWKPPRFHSTKG